MLISGIADCQQHWVKPIANTGTFVYNDKVNQGIVGSISPGCLYKLPLIEMDCEKKLLKEKEVCELIGCSKSTLWRMVGRGDFPRPYKFGQRLTRWNNYEIHIWMTELCETI